MTKSLFQMNKCNHTVPDAQNDQQSLLEAPLNPHSVDHLKSNDLRWPKCSDQNIRTIQAHKGIEIQRQDRTFSMNVTACVFWPQSILSEEDNTPRDTDPEETDPDLDGQFKVCTIACVRHIEANKADVDTPQMKGHGEPRMSLEKVRTKVTQSRTLIQMNDRFVMKITP